MAVIGRSGRCNDGEVGGIPQTPAPPQGRSDPVADHACRAVVMARGCKPGSSRWPRRGEHEGSSWGWGRHRHWIRHAREDRLDGRYDYTPIGTTVNLAARLCDKAGPGTILASQKTIVVALASVRLITSSGLRWPSVADP
jgi:hypothetical protein